MEIKTECGIEINCLPDCAKCERTGRNPMEMDACPMNKFGYMGDTCIPELCEDYTEEW